MNQQAIKKFISQLSGKVEGCWEFNGYTNPNGYGVFSIKKQKYYAHRVAYALANNLDPKNLNGIVMHLCNNRKCCNPAHLSLGTNEQNLMYMRMCGRDRVERDTSAKLDAEDVKAIRTRLEVFGHSQNSLAEKFNCSRRTIYDIANYRTWKHIDRYTKPALDPIVESG